MGIESQSNSVEDNLYSSLNITQIGENNYSITTKLGVVTHIEKGAIDFMNRTVDYIVGNKGSAKLNKIIGGHQISIGTNYSLTSKNEYNPSNFSENGNEKTCSITLFQGIIDTCRDKYQMF